MNVSPGLLTVFRHNSLKMAAEIVNIAIKEEDYETAIKAQTICIELFPNAINYKDRAEIHEAAGNLNEANADYLQSLMHHNDSHTWACRARVFNKLGQDDKAQETLNEANELLLHEYQKGRYVSMPTAYKL